MKPETTPRGNPIHDKTSDPNQKFILYHHALDHNLVTKCMKDIFDILFSKKEFCKANITRFAIEN